MRADPSPRAGRARALRVVASRGLARRPAGDALPKRRFDPATARVFGAERFTRRDLFDSRGSAGAANRAGKTADPAPAWRCGAGFPAPRAAHKQERHLRPGAEEAARGPGLAPVGHAFRPRPALPDSTPPPGSAGSPQADAPSAAQRPLLHKSLCSAVCEDSWVPVGGMCIMHNLLYRVYPASIRTGAFNPVRSNKATRANRKVLEL